MNNKTNAQDSIPIKSSLLAHTKRFITSVSTTKYYDFRTNISRRPQSGVTRFVADQQLKVTQPLITFLTILFFYLRLLKNARTVKLPQAVGRRFFNQEQQPLTPAALLIPRRRPKPRVTDGQVRCWTAAHELLKLDPSSCATEDRPPQSFKPPRAVAVRGCATLENIQPEERGGRLSPWGGTGLPWRSMLMPTSTAGTAQTIQLAL